MVVAVSDAPGVNESLEPVPAAGIFPVVMVVTVPEIVPPEVPLEEEPVPSEVIMVVVRVSVNVPFWLSTTERSSETSKGSDVQVLDMVEKDIPGGQFTREATQTPFSSC